VDYQPINDRDQPDNKDWDQPTNPEREPKNDNPIRFDY
jgi:hypothetical protein